MHVRVFQQQLGWIGPPIADLPGALGRLRACPGQGRLTVKGRPSVVALAVNRPCFFPGQRRLAKLRIVHYNRYADANVPNQEEWNEVHGRKR